MAEESTGRTAGIATDVILEFDKSIKNIQEFGNQMAMLDARFGAIDQRIENMRNSLSTLSAQTSRATGSNLRKQIEQELSNLVAANGVVLSSIGNAPLKVKQETVRNLFARVDAELNRAISRQIGNINIQIDPNFNTGTVPIGKDEFAELNKEIARLVRMQTKNLVDSIRKNGANLISADDVQGLNLSIGRGTVGAIMQRVKEQIKPALLNPEVSEVQLNFTQSDLNSMLRKIKAKVKEALDFDFDGVLTKNNDVDGEILKTARKIDNLVENYVKTIRDGMNRIDPRGVEVPIKDLSRRLRQYIAKDLQVTEQQLERQLKTIDSGSASGYELRRQFSSLERTINSKMTSGTSKLVTDLRQSIRAVDIEPSSTLKHYLIHEINKLNNEIVKKIREQVDRQFQHMRAEVQTVNTDPRTINRSGRLRGMASGYGGNFSTPNQTIINNNYGSRTPAHLNTNVADPYARRDNYMNSFGIEGAVVNTLRHVLAGGMVGVPMMAAYQAMETFKTSQLEQLKVFQNYMMKDEYQVANPDGTNTPDFAKVQNEVNELVPTIKNLAGLYAVEYGEMSKVASVASRMTSTKEEANAFMDYASMIYRLDNEGDLVNTIAPGLEAIMGQFDLSVWHMDEVVKSFGVATNISKTTTDELMNAMMRSGATFEAANIGIEAATMMTASALQSTGLTGENIGNMFKTVNTRLGMESVQNKLSEYGIDVYETDDRGRRMRRGGLDVWTDIGNLVASNRIGDEALDNLLQVTAGGYQIGKVRAFIESLNDLGVESEHGLNVHDMIAKSQQYEMDAIHQMLAKSMNSNIMNMERAGVEFDLALTSVLESLAPTIETLADVIVNLSQGIRENSDMIAGLIGAIGNTIIGAAAWYGGSKLLNRGGNFQSHLANVELQDNLWGRRGLSGRQQTGTMDSLGGILDSRTNPLHHNSNQSRAFLTQAMRNESLSPYITELATMDSKRKSEIERYMRDTRGRDGRVTDLADFFSVMDESRDYQGRRRMTADEMHRNSSFNARQMTANKSMQNVLTDAFRSSLNETFSNRTSFAEFNASSQNRQFTRGFARMDNGTRGDFTNFLERNYGSVGKQISDMEGLRRAFADFNTEQRRSAVDARNASPQLQQLRLAIGGINETINSPVSRGDRFLDFLDNVGRRGRAAIPTILELGKSIGRMGLQMMAFQALGDIISDNVANASLTQSQKELRDMETEMKAGRKYLDMQNAGFGGQLLGSLGLMYNSVVDTFSEGNNKVGVGDVTSFKSDFESWMSKEYGTKNLQRATKETGKTQDALLAEFLGSDASGNMQRKYDQLEYENFMKEYQEMTVAQGIKDDMKAQADAMKRQSDLEKWLKGEDIGLSIEDTINTMKEQFEQLARDNSIELIVAQLEGVKSNSVEFLQLRKKQLEEESKIYEQQMELSRKNIKMYREQLQALKDSGQDEVWDEEKGKYVKSDEYLDTERNLNKEVTRQEEVQREFELAEYQRQLETRKINFQIARKPIDDRLEDSSHSRQMSDLWASLGYAENSRGFYDNRIVNAQAELASMRKSLTEYQAIDPKLDVDGELKNIIKNLEKSILDQTIELKNLRLSRVLSYREDLNEFNDNQEIDMLRQQVSMGGLDASDPALQGFRISQLNKQRNELERHISGLRAAMQDPNSTADEQSKIAAEIRELTKQSLQAQLGIYQEIKNTGGTFNLPDGVRVLSQYDYMASRGTHSNMTIQSGDTYVSITLPNLTDKSGSKAFADAGYQIGQGIAEGRSNSYRKQLSGSPWNYPSY